LKELEGLPIDNHKDLDESVLKKNKKRSILAIGQDIVSCNSGGRKKMPRNVRRPWAGYENRGVGKGNNHFGKPLRPLYKVLGMYTGGRKMSRNEFESI